MKITKVILLITTTFLSFNTLAIDKKTLEKFSQYDNNSDFVIMYDDVDTLLQASVLYMGNSTRQQAKQSKPSIGTRLKNRVKPLTELEGNRFFYETFDTPEKIALISNIRKSLEQIPTDSPLHFFSKDEQLAYWLNLYNLSLIEQLVQIYPKKNIQSLIEEDSILDKKHLSVANETLSLNDIKTIVINNFGYDPLLIYGFHQGNIASPDIRTKAYTGKKVWNNLKRNANVFINSNRGTFGGDSNTMRVSYLYEQNKAFFKDFDADLKAHLAKYLLRSYKDKLLAANHIKTNIKNWNIADLYGTTRVYGGSVATNSAALIDAFVSAPGDAYMNTGAMNANISEYSPLRTRLSTEQMDKMVALMKVQELRKGTVTITDEEYAEGNKQP
ncbi:DUF547 domain-containing protein [Colwellia sp. 1_MG-2023]|uniref:DUF547 domain-containing protein n=1 Tax=Colwellia sp. 1_MG-2023 TaxID=3062649 RepID=UPI0026E2DA1C|nr:DUF547 domain-containing protein [Colwellia sp. 1_MG-2023]MDO6445343.1 DUF547 domain-containing protein [Colwellia sp. 1_MG-2023]